MNPRKPPVCLITPALARVDSGNWQTAQGWPRMVATDFEVRLARQWDGRDASVMLALHARRSADSIVAWAAQRPRRPLAVVLAGTDLYRDIHTDPRARRSLALADRLVVLHDRAPSDVPAAYRDKCVVCFQSCGARRPVVADVGEVPFQDDLQAIPPLQVAMPDESHLLRFRSRGLRVVKGSRYPNQKKNNRLSGEGKPPFLSNLLARMR